MIDQTDGPPRNSQGEEIWFARNKEADSRYPWRVASWKGLIPFYGIPFCVVAACLPLALVASPLPALPRVLVMIGGIALAFWLGLLWLGSVYRRHLDDRNSEPPASGRQHHPTGI